MIRTVGIKIKHIVIFVFNNRIKKSCFFLFLLLWALFAFSCDPYRILKMGNLENVISIPCGKIDVEAKVMGRTLFTINLKCDLTGELWINPDSLKIIHRSKSLDFELWKDVGSGTDIKDRTLIRGKSDIRIYFSTHLDPVCIGDTIIIAGNGFLSCEEKSILPDTISIIIDK